MEFTERGSLLAGACRTGGFQKSAALRGAGGGDGAASGCGVHFPACDRDSLSRLRHDEGASGGSAAGFQSGVFLSPAVAAADPASGAGGF